MHFYGAPTHRMHHLCIFTVLPRSCRQRLTTTEKILTHRLYAAGLDSWRHYLCIFTVLPRTWRHHLCIFTVLPRT